MYIEKLLLNILFSTAFNYFHRTSDRFSKYFERKGAQENNIHSKERHVFLIKNVIIII